MPTFLIILAWAAGLYVGAVVLGALWLLLMHGLWGWGWR